MNKMNQPATKSDLENLRTELKSDIDTVKTELRTEIRIGIDEAFDKYDEKNRGYIDKVLTRLDGVAKEPENIREDNAVGTDQIRELREEVDGHEKRITKLEIPTH